MISVRDSVKGAIETALVIGGGAALARRKRSNQLLVLAYHNIVPNGSRAAGDRSLQLPQSFFAAQLEMLLETHDVIGLGDALSRPAATVGRHPTRPRAVITFDDAYAGALTAGVEELRVRGLPATIFVTPAFLDGKPFWWDVLSDAVTGLDRDMRERALTDCRGLTTEVLTLASSEGVPALEMPQHTCGASMAQLTAALKYEKILFAAHTWNHANLTALTDSELDDELARPLEWLQRFGDRAIPMVSYPYGLADERVHRAARRAGYSAGFMIDGGWTRSMPQNPFAVARLNVPAGVSRDGFVLRAAGLIQG